MRSEDDPDTDQEFHRAGANSRIQSSGVNRTEPMLVSSQSSFVDMSLRRDQLHSNGTFQTLDASIIKKNGSDGGKTYMSLEQLLDLKTKSGWLGAIFLTQDENKDGKLSFGEWSGKVQRGMYGIANYMWPILDKDATGVVDRQQFESMFIPAGTATFLAMGAEMAKAPAANKPPTWYIPEAQVQEVIKKKKDRTIMDKPNKLNILESEARFMMDEFCRGSEAAGRGRGEKASSADGRVDEDEWNQFVYTSLLSRSLNKADERVFGALPMDVFDGIFKDPDKELQKAVRQNNEQKKKQAQKEGLSEKQTQKLKTPKERVNPSGLFKELTNRDAFKYIYGAPIDQTSGGKPADKEERERRAKEKIAEAAKRRKERKYAKGEE